MQLVRENGKILHGYEHVHIYPLFTFTYNTYTCTLYAHCMHCGKKCLCTEHNTVRWEASCGWSERAQHFLAT